MLGSTSKLLWRCNKRHEWEATANSRSNGNGCPYCSNQKMLLGFNDLTTINPELAKEISPRSKIKTEEVTAGSNRKLLWRCGKGHEWKATTSNRSQGKGCPYCSNKKILIGFNDLATTNPDLAKEVSPNSKIKATEVTAGSKKKLLWRCGKNHEWESRVLIRSHGSNCPYCSNKKIIPGFNDLATTNPKIAEEVSPNSKIKATEVTSGSNKKLLWRCGKGHDWEATVSSRFQGKGCAYCSNRKILPGFNDLATTNPKIAEEVSPNSKIKSTEITSFSNKKLLWKCSKGHEWKATVSNRSRGRGCPYCSNREMLPGFNDLKTVNPGLAKEVSSNSKIKATEVTISSGKKLLWKCSKGHEWKATVCDRSGGNGCPYCSNRKILTGFNDLATINPELAKEVSSNSKIKATEVTIGSRKKLLWRCDNDHEWEATVKSRSKGTCCPKCSGSKMEEILAQLIKTLLPRNTPILRNDRQLIKPYELDILIPNLSLAFEFNGDYWHNNENIRKRHPQFKNSKHFDSFKKCECEKQGVELFFVREKQWVNNYEKTVERVKKIVARKLNQQ